VFFFLELFRYYSIKLHGKDQAWITNQKDYYKSTTSKLQGAEWYFKGFPQISQASLTSLNITGSK